MSPGPWRGLPVKASDDLTLHPGPKRRQDTAVSGTVAVARGGHETCVSAEQFLTILLKKYIYIYTYIYCSIYILLIDRECVYILEKEMAAHSSTLAWKTLWMEEPGRLLSMGSHEAKRLSRFTGVYFWLFSR